MQTRLPVASLLLLLAISIPLSQASAIELWKGPGRLNGLAALSGGSFLVVGEVAESADQNTSGFAALVDVEGNIIWNNLYGIGGEDSSSLSAVAVDIEGNAWMAGVRDSLVPGHNTDAWVVKVDHTGNILLMDYVGGPGFDFASGVVALPTGGAMLVMRREVDLRAEIRFVTFNSEGTIIREIPTATPMPTGVPGSLYTYDPGVLEGAYEEPGFVLAGTQFVRQGSSRPFLLYLRPARKDFDLWIPSQSGSATRVLPCKGLLYSVWTEVSGDGRSSPGAAIIGGGGIRPVNIDKGAGSASPFGLDVDCQGRIWVGLNVEYKNQRSVEVLSFFDGQECSAAQNHLISVYQNREGHALLILEGNLVIAGQTPPKCTRSGDPRPWLTIAPIVGKDRASLLYDRSPRSGCTPFP